MNRIVLASNSPRRKELLEQANIEFIVDSKNVEEVFDETLPLSKQMMEVSYQKARALLAKYPDDIIIGADTMVVYKSIKMGKPKDRKEAKETLHLLSGNIHQVITGVSILYLGKIEQFIETTNVGFKKLTDKEIKDYLDMNEWEDKAGSYAIQGYANKFVTLVEGDRNNVIGLPVSKVLATISKICD